MEWLQKTWNATVIFVIFSYSFRSAFAINSCDCTLFYRVGLFAPEYKSVNISKIISTFTNAKNEMCLDLTHKANNWTQWSTLWHEKQCQKGALKSDARGSRSSVNMWRAGSEKVLFMVLFSLIYEASQSPSTLLFVVWKRAARTFCLLKKKSIHKGL